MAENPIVEWKDISYLPFIGNLIDQGVKDNEDSYQTFLETKSRSHVLDDATVERIFKVYGAQRDARIFRLSGPPRFRRNFCSPCPRRPSSQATTILPLDRFTFGCNFINRTIFY